MLLFYLFFSSQIGFFFCCEGYAFKLLQLYVGYLYFFFFSAALALLIYVVELYGDCISFARSNFAVFLVLKKKTKKKTAK